MTKRLKDILEPEVDEKYYLSEKMLQGFNSHTETQKAKGNGFKFDPITNTDTEIASCVTARVFKMGVDDNYIKEQVLVSKEVRTEEAKAERRATGSNSFRGKEIRFAPSEVMNCLQTGLTNDHLIIVKEATKLGYATAADGDSINLLQPNSKTRRGRVGNKIANTLDTSCSQAVVVGHTTNERIAGWHENENIIGAHRSDAKRSSVSEHIYHKPEGICTTIQTAHTPKLFGQRIRRLTPLECMRLQGFPDEYIKPCSDSQTYKMAGNSITVNVMEAIIRNLLHLL